MPHLPNFVAGRWVAGTGPGTCLRDPLSGTALATVDSTGLDLPGACGWARQVGGAALRALSYAQRAALLAKVAEVLQANRDKYYDIALRNAGTVRQDSAVDIDGGIYTLSYYAKLGAGLADQGFRADGEPVSLARDDAYAVQHIAVPVRGLALLINAFNFPSWGLWEKAGPALLSGVPIVVKPATATAWLAHEMVSDVLAAAVLPEGALSLVCGASTGLLDALAAGDVLSFTGSSDTAALLRAHPRVARDGVRMNAETDSLNCAVLGPDAAEGGAACDALVREAVREITVKSGQKCTAIRRILVPQAAYARVADTIASRLAGITVGDPRNADVRMGSLVSRAQHDDVQAGIRALRAGSEVLFDGGQVRLVDADPAVAACVAPWLLGAPDPDSHPLAHDREVFGPAATLMPYRDTAHAYALARRGQGSLVASVYSDDTGFLARSALELADSHGRVHLVSPEAAKAHSGHGNVMPQSLHGGPGRAGGGEELGGLRALALYHRRAAIQGAPGRLRGLADATGPA
ncbi:3,4-dehydroadipyl-CoA semialdehyde dehydrogenase [Bordetella sp. BOR01]|uniref:3,4-dehydroadipyl-CoA semialdehyde dehydrogenase n=1 Tax=Bordetella sp. BOR01 TaxID=2854779 RepID=UPI001C4557BF|nr:3,4-dehydroadipyl-CoA semialdehyde dehydrogenase [Bordetella sp. BOR01]MBV7484199.1 3,4-dehydroadipyl-CoA semialdehyde dehydrogenase [Bordetella sp. BOR01]